MGVALCHEVGAPPPRVVPLFRRASRSPDGARHPRIGRPGKGACLRLVLADEDHRREHVTLLVTREYPRPSGDEGVVLGELALQALGPAGAVVLDEEVIAGALPVRAGHARDLDDGVCAQVREGGDAAQEMAVGKLDLAGGHRPSLPAAPGEGDLELRER